MWLHWGERPAAAKPFFEQNLYEGDRGHGRGIESDGANLIYRLAANQKDGTHWAARGNCDAGQDHQTWDLRVGGGWDDADIGGTCLQRTGAGRGQRVRNIEVTAGVAVFEIPHQRSGVEVGNRRDA